LTTVKKIVAGEQMIDPKQNFEVIERLR